VPRAISRIIGRGGGSLYGVSRYLASDDHAFWLVAGEQNDYVTDAELNLTQEINRSTQAELLAAIANSGFFQLGAFAFGAPLAATQFGIPESRASVNGAIVHVGDPGASGRASSVTLAAAPGVGAAARSDAAFLEVWLQEVLPTASANGQSSGLDANVYQYGGVANATFPNDSLDPVINLETVRRVQLRWRLVPVSGVNTTTSPNGLGDPACLAQAGAATPLAGMPYTVSPLDSHLWFSGDGLAAPLLPPASVTVTPTGGASGGASYSYRVTAYYQGTNGEYSETTTAVGTTSASFVTLSGGTYNALSWGAVGGASGYKIYGRTAGGELYLTSLSGSSSTSWSDTGSIAPAGAYPLINTTGGATLLNSADGYVWALPVATIARLGNNAETSLGSSIGAGVSIVTDVRVGAATWTPLVAGNATISGIDTAASFSATTATGTAPYRAVSTTLNANLNADYTDGYHAAAPGTNSVNTLASYDVLGRVVGAAWATALGNAAVSYPPSAPGIATANSAAITNSVGQVGAALLAAAASTVLDTGGVARSGSAPGGQQANSAAITDSSGRVGRALTADQVTGFPPTASGGSATVASVPITDTSGYVYGANHLAAFAPIYVGNGTGYFVATSNPSESDGGFLEYYAGTGASEATVSAAGGATLTKFRVMAATTEFTGNVNVDGTVLTVGGVEVATVNGGSVASALYANNAGLLNNLPEVIANTVNTIPQRTTVAGSQGTVDLTYTGLLTNVNGWAMGLYLGANGAAPRVGYPGVSAYSVAWVQSDDFIHNDVTYSAGSLRDPGGTPRYLANPGVNTAYTVPIYDGYGRVQDSEGLDGQNGAYYATQGGLNSTNTTLNAHLAANYVNGTSIHGLYWTGYGGVGANAIAVTGASGAVGRALALIDGGGNARGVGQAGDLTAYAVPITDASGWVGGSRTVGGRRRTVGKTTLTANNNGDTGFTISMDDNSFTPSGCNCTVSAPGGAPGIEAYPTSLVAGTISGHVANGGGTTNITIYCEAWQ
jgi:hypothetical protein